MPQAMRVLWPTITAGMPGNDAPVTFKSGACRWFRYQIPGSVYSKCGSFARMGLPSAVCAPEIAQAMLRRQQAEAVIAARQKIVQGAVSMVDMALKELAEKHVVVLDDERKAAMVSNLMVVLCGESEVHPVVNTGTLYN